jgi:transcription elongation factor Elf1
MGVNVSKIFSAIDKIKVERKYPCPVCGANMTRETDYMDYTLCEEYLICYTCNLYSFEFSYGSYRETVYPYEMTWSYSTSYDEIADMSLKLLDYIMIVRQAGCL